MSSTAEECPWELELLYRDDDLVVINKPSGLSVHRGWDQGDFFAMNLTRDLVGQYVYPVHRLDRPTSGVLVFLLKSELVQVMQGSFDVGDVQKHYIALTRGVTEEEGRIDYALRSKGRREGPRVEAITDYERRFVFEGRYSVVSVYPRTGRLHQIRRHLRHISHHLIGDVNYGKGEHNRIFRERFGLNRLGLHALEIVFPHPVTGVRMHVQASPPEDLARPFAQMGVGEEVWEARMGG